MCIRVQNRMKYWLISISTLGGYPRHCVILYIFCYFYKVTKVLGNHNGALDFFLKAHEIYSRLQKSIDSADCAFAIGRILKHA